MPIAVQGICDLEVRIGKEKISLGSVVIADIDFNVLSCFSMQERGWRTVLGAKNSNVVKGKMRFPIQMAERAWWMTVKSTRKDNGVKPMEVDRVGVMISAKDATCAKVEMTKVAQVNAAAKLQAAKEAAAPKAGPLGLVESQARSLVLHETRDAAILAARALECKPFGAFSFVCRMLRHGGVSDETFGGLPVTVELDGEEDELVPPPPGLEAGADIAPPDDNEGYLPSSGSDEELIPAEPPRLAQKIPGELGGDGGSGGEELEPSLDGNPLLGHESRGHWPYDAGCGACVQARGRTPARRIRNDAEPEGLGADFLFFGNGKYWKVLILVMFATGMLGMVVMSGDREKDVRRVVSVMNEIGVGGLNLEVVMDNEAFLQSLVNAALMKSNCRSFHPRHVAVARPQAKRLERFVGICREGVFANWLALQEHLKVRLALEAPVLGYLIGHVYRTYNAFQSREGGTPLERLRGVRGSQTPRTFPFGAIGFAKPVHPSNWPGQRLIAGVYLGPRYSSGGGCLVFPLGTDAHGRREVCRCHNFRIRDYQDGSPFEVEALWPLVAGVRPGEPAGVPGDPFGRKQPERELPVLEDVDADDFWKPEGDLPKPPSSTAVEVPTSQVEAPVDMEVEPSADAEMPELEEEEDDHMLERLALAQQEEEYVAFLRRDAMFTGERFGEVHASDGSKETSPLSFQTTFGQLNMHVEVPRGPIDELTHLPLIEQEVLEGMKTEMSQLETLKVGTCLPEDEGRELAKKANVKILSSRWVLTQKKVGLARCRLVVREFVSGADSPFKSGIYAPTSSLDSLRTVLALTHLRKLHLKTLDVSTAFMYAPVEDESCDLVMLPGNITTESRRGRRAMQRVICRLLKAMNGLRRAPLLWFKELLRKVNSLHKGNGTTQTFEPTLFRLELWPGSVILLLVYVDDLLLAASTEEELEELVGLLQKVWKIKVTGSLPWGQPGVLQFLGRQILREREGDGPLLFGVGRDYMSSLLNAWNETGEKLKPWTSKVMPNFEEVVKTFQHDAPLTKQAQLRFRKVLGMLAWVALSRSDLTFSVSYLARGQADPRQSLEACMRSLLRWIQLGENLHKMQSFPTPKPLRTSGPTELVAYVDASWNLQSVSGGIVTYQGITLKTFSRKQDVPAMSSAEAELAAMVEACKELLSIGCLLDTLKNGIPLDALGCPKTQHHSLKMELFTDSQSAQSITAMYGLLRRVKHVELRYAFLQHLVQQKRLRVHFVRGLDNPADALTKSAKTTPMLDHLCAEAGLVQLTNTGAAVIQAVREVDVSAADGGGVDFDSPSLSLVRPQKRVSFSMKVDGFWWLEDRADRD